MITVSRFYLQMTGLFYFKVKNSWIGWEISKRYFQLKKIVITINNFLSIKDTIILCFGNTYKMVAIFLSVFTLPDIISLLFI